MNYRLPGEGSKVKRLRVVASGSTMATYKILGVFVQCVDVNIVSSQVHFASAQLEIFHSH